MIAGEPIEDHAGGASSGPVLGPSAEPPGTPGGLGSDRTAVAEVDRLFDDVEGALERLQDATYGICEACGQSIEDERLAVAPTSRTCARHPQLTDPSPAR